LKIENEKTNSLPPFGVLPLGQGKKEVAAKLTEEFNLKFKIINLK